MLLILSFFGRDRLIQRNPVARMSGNLVGLYNFGGLRLVGLGYRLGGIVRLVHRALEVANRFAHRAADVAELAGPEDDQNYQQNDQQVSWRKQVHIFLRAGRRPASPPKSLYP